MRKTGMLLSCIAMCTSSSLFAADSLFLPAGELSARINLVHERFSKITEPAFTDAFILADVMLDPEYPRRFDDFSGDISGRFLGALSMMSRGAEEDAWLHRLVEKILACQRKDGRFGREILSFATGDIGLDQMALLWGNGRLLVGLLEYYQRFPDTTGVLDAAVRLSDFFLAVYENCKQPEVMERLRGKAANGFICFTQFNEGLELLARATGKETYRDAARTMEPLLEARGDQHTHGYLTTLRGHLLIYESTKEPALLAAVEARHQDMLDSGSVMINGGLLEYFKPDYNRDEGCSEADFLRLCIQLWKASGKEKYLLQAERCLYNIFYANQFETGDFGHRCYDGRGYVPHPGAGRAWWCCTMHGMRAFRDVLDAAVARATEQVGGSRPISINLWQCGVYADPEATLRIKNIGNGDGKERLAFRLTLESGPTQGTTLLLRIPEWAEAVEVWRIEGDNKQVVEQRQDIASDHADSSAAPIVLETVTAGNTVEVYLTCRLYFVNRKNVPCNAQSLSSESAEEYAVFFGPWLMGMDSYWNPMFHGEPYADNELFFPQTSVGRGLRSFEQNPGMPLLNGPRLQVTYKHGGFPDLCQATMHPVSDQTAHLQSTVSYWHRVRAVNP